MGMEGGTDPHLQRSHPHPAHTAQWGHSLVPPLSVPPGEGAVLGAGCIPPSCEGQSGALQDAATSSMVTATLQRPGLQTSMHCIHSSLQVQSPMGCSFCPCYPKTTHETLRRGQENPL